MLSAIEESFTELRRWMPWAQNMPTEEVLDFGTQMDTS